MILYIVCCIIQKLLYHSVPISVRDILSWIKFINQSVVKLGPESSFYHGVCLVFLDGIGCGSGEVERISRSAAETFISSLFNKYGKKLRKPAVTAENGFYGISPFYIEKGSASTIAVRKMAHGLCISNWGWGGDRLLLSTQNDTNTIQHEI